MWTSYKPRTCGLKVLAIVVSDETKYNIIISIIFKKKSSSSFQKPNKIVTLTLKETRERKKNPTWWTKKDLGLSWLHQTNKGCVSHCGLAIYIKKIS
jgi:hypothetical protein